MKRKKLLIGATLAVLIGLIVLIPARTYAQSILRRLGGITLTTQEPVPTYEQDTAATLVAEMKATWESGPTPTPKPAHILSEDEIQSLAGFPGWYPNFVPEGYTLHSKVVVHDNFGNPIVRTSFRQENKPLFGSVLIHQWMTLDNPRDPIRNWNIGDAPVSNVMVNGELAVFVKKAKIIPPPGANILIWTTNDYTFTMIGEDLNQTTIIAVAESMQAP